MPRRTDTRERMVRTAAALFQRQGYAATGWRQVVAESATPWGSQSHHFPLGKEELAVDAITHSGRSYARLVENVFERSHPADAIRSWSALAAEVLAGSAWADGCPIATVALERAHESDAIGDACDASFDAWQAAIADGLRRHGASPERAEPLATLILTAIEGALLVARAKRDAAPLLTVGAELALTIEAELPRSS